MAARPSHRQPDVIIIARHGPRLDAADHTWHLSTPTPYDPPLTYAGWNQSRALGVRIASLLEARQIAHDVVDEPAEDTSPSVDGVHARDFAQKSASKRKDKDDSQDGSEKKKTKKKLKHKVVIHTSPFLRCVQTSVAIAAGMAEYRPSRKPGNNGGSGPKSPSSLNPATSPRLRALEHTSLATNLSSPPDSRHDLAHAVARRVLEQKPRYRKTKLRVDAFLGEWLNPQYFDQITPPPPSPMMVTTAKAALMSTEQIDVYAPTMSAKSSNSSLWRSSNAQRMSEGGVDDMSAIRDSLPVSSSSRSRSSTVSSGASDEGESGRRSPFRAGHVFKPHQSTLQNQLPDPHIYIPPMPQYAISGSDQIPRGYVGHAREATVDVDYHWDSSRAPQDWPDGGELGEEWSTMHKRVRKGLNDLIQWYSSNDVDARAEDALGTEQAEIYATEDDEFEEELVVILVTHGAGSNSIIGALTGQPVLLDVGMASLTMAVRRDDAPLVNEKTSPGNQQEPSLQFGVFKRRSSVERGLPAFYDMKLVSSSEHLRVNPAKAAGLNAARSNLPAFREPDRADSQENSSRRNVNSALGSIRRPSATNAYPGRPDAPARADSSPVPTTSKDGIAQPSPPLTPGLWTPPAARAPVLKAQTAADEPAKVPQESIVQSPVSVPDVRSRLTSSGFTRGADAQTQVPPGKAMALALNGAFESTSGVSVGADKDRKASLSDLPLAGENPPQALSRGLSQRGLWGSKPTGDQVARHFGQEPKRRWTVNED